jgi:hypothetical protein
MQLEIFKLNHNRYTVESSPPISGHPADCATDAEAKFAYMTRDRSHGHGDV